MFQSKSTQDSNESSSEVEENSSDDSLEFTTPKKTTQITTSNRFGSLVNINKEQIGTDADFSLDLTAIPKESDYIPSREAPISKGATSQAAQSSVAQSSGSIAQSSVYQISNTSISDYKTHNHDPDVFSLFFFHPVTSPLRLPDLSNTDTTTFRKWLSLVEDELDTLGIKNILTEKVRTSLTEAIESKKHKYDTSAITEVYKAIHRRIFGAIRKATREKMGHAFYLQIEQTQKDEEKKWRQKGNYDKPLPFIHNNAHYLWRNMKSTYDRAAFGDKLNLKIKLQSLKYKSGTDPMALRAQFLELKSNLEHLGTSLTEEDLLGYWITYIPDDLSAIRQVYTTNEESTWIDVYKALYNDYIHSRRGIISSAAQPQPQKKITPADSAQALKEKEEKQPEVKLYCTYCKETTHTFKRCKKLKEKKQQEDKTSTAKSDEGQPHFERLTMVREIPSSAVQQTDDSESTYETLFVVREIYQPPDTGDSLYMMREIHPHSDQLLPPLPEASAATQNSSESIDYDLKKSMRNESHLGTVALQHFSTISVTLSENQGKSDQPIRCLENSEKIRKNINSSETIRIDQDNSSWDDLACVDKKPHLDNRSFSPKNTIPSGSSFCRQQLFNVDPYATVLNDAISLLPKLNNDAHTHPLWTTAWKADVDLLQNDEDRIWVPNLASPPKSLDQLLIDYDTTKSDYKSTITEPIQPDHLEGLYMMAENMSSKPTSISHAQACAVTHNRKYYWMVDSGATRHITPYLDILTDTEEVDSVIFTTATDKQLKANIKGTVRVTSTRDLHGVLHVPGGTQNLLSVSRFTETGKAMLFTKDQLLILKRTPQVPDSLIDFAVEKKGDHWGFTCKVDRDGNPLLKTSEEAKKEGFANRPKPLPPAAVIERQKIPQKARKVTFDDEKKENANYCQEINSEFYESREFALTISEIPLTTSQLLLDKYSGHAYLLHCRAGHPSLKVLKKIIEMNKKDIHISDAELKQFADLQCPICIQSKAMLPAIGTKGSERFAIIRKLQVICFDICGPMSIVTSKGHLHHRQRGFENELYLLVIVIARPYFAIVFPITKKSDIDKLVIATVEEFQTKTKEKLEYLVHDQARENMTKILKDFLVANGTQSSPSPTYTPALNGIVERMNRTIFEKVRAFLEHSQAPYRLWPEAARYAAFLHNINPSPSLDMKTPFQDLLDYTFPHYKLHIWGCDAYVTLPKHLQAKLQKKTWIGSHVGFNWRENTYRIMDDKGEIQSVLNATFIDRDFSHLKHIKFKTPSTNTSTRSATPSAWSISPPSIILDNTPHSFHSGEAAPTITPPDIISAVAEGENEEEIQQPETKQSANAEQKDEPIKVKPKYAGRELRNLHKDWHIAVDQDPNLINIVNQAPQLQQQEEQKTEIDSACVLLEEHIENEDNIFTRVNPIIKIPKNHAEAMASPEWEHWDKAEKKEMSSLDKFEAFKVVTPPPGAKIFPARMVYAVKFNPNGTIKQFKCRYVFGGHLQIHGRDYLESYAPVSKMKDIRFIFSFAITHGYEIYQLDFDTAFLNALLDKVLYCRQPQGHIRGKPGDVWLLLKSLYGLVQAGRNWNKHLDQFLKGLGFKAVGHEPCIYWKSTKTNNLLILSVYVDDLLSVFKMCDVDEWLQIKYNISSTFDIKDLGECQWILNIRVQRDRANHIICLTQDMYIQQLLMEYDMTEATIESTPCPQILISSIPGDSTPAIPLSKSEHERYQSLIGALLYLANTTRMDICFHVHRLSQYVQKPMQHHWKYAKRILRYLKGTMYLGLVFKRHDVQMYPHALEVFSDADWGTDIDGRKSVTGVLMKHCGNIIHWTSRKQKLTALSTMEAEYVALAHATKDAIWGQQLLYSLFDKRITVQIHCDNQAAITFSHNDTQHDKTRHIDLKYHRVKDHITNGDIVVTYIPTTDQQADGLTKNLPKGKFLYFREMMLHHNELER